MTAIGYSAVAEVQSVIRQQPIPKPKADVEVRESGRSVSESSLTCEHWQIGEFQQVLAILVIKPNEKSTIHDIQL